MSEELSKSMVDMKMAAHRLIKENREHPTRALSVAITELETAILWLERHQIEVITGGSEFGD